MYRKYAVVLAPGNDLRLYLGNWQLGACHEGLGEGSPVSPSAKALNSVFAHLSPESLTYSPLSVRSGLPRRSSSAFW